MTGRIVLAFCADLAATLLFVLAGRDSHNSGGGILGLLTTWWPFAVALLVGWLVTVAWKRPFGVLWPAVGIWLVTVAGGMLLRAASGQGTALPFVIVATIAVGLLLVGWRAGYAVASRLRRRVRAKPRGTLRQWI